MVGLLFFSSKSNGFVLKGRHNIDDLGSFRVNLIKILSADSCFPQNLVTPGVALGSVDRAVELFGPRRDDQSVAVLHPAPLIFPNGIVWSVTGCPLSVDSPF